MNKNIMFLIIALKNITRDYSRMLGIAVPLFAIMFLISAMSFFREGIKRDAKTSLEYYPDILLQQQVGGRTESLLLDRYDLVLDKIKGIKL